MYFVINNKIGFDLIQLFHEKLPALKLKLLGDIQESTITVKENIAYMCVFVAGSMSYLCYMCLFVYNGVQAHIVLCFCFAFLRLVYPMLLVSLDCPFLDCSFGIL